MRIGSIRTCKLQCLRKHGTHLLKLSCLLSNLLVLRLQHCSRDPSVELLQVQRATAYSELEEILVVPSEGVFPSGRTEIQTKAQPRLVADGLLQSSRHTFFKCPCWRTKLRYHVETRGTATGPKGPQVKTTLHPHSTKCGLFSLRCSQLLELRSS